MTVLLDSQGGLVRQSSNTNPQQSRVLEQHTERGLSQQVTSVRVTWELTAAAEMPAV